jgi:hypothetical protein
MVSEYLLGKRSTKSDLMTWTADAAGIAVTSTGQGRGGLLASVSIERSTR